MILNAYLFIPEYVHDKGVIEYHSQNPGNLLESERIENVMYDVVVKTRLSEAEVKQEQITDWLKSIKLKITG